MAEDTRLPLASPDPAADLVAQLRAAAPQMFSEGKIDFEKLRTALGESVDSGPERYGLNWAGKSEAFRNVQTPSVGTLLPMPEESVNWDSTENLIIEGDNLEVLKLLQKPYHGKVKMIYIDPPYNTGNDFVYHDDYRQGLEQYLRYSGQITEEGTKQSTNTDTSGRFHSNWLSMMYPRLFLARNLLREDGVIFVSIDDNEMHNLRMLMNEIFGEENFLGQISVVSNPKGRVLGEHFARSHDYLIVFSKSELEEELSVEKADDEIEEQYTEQDKLGSYRLLELRNTHRQFGRFNRKNLFFPLYVDSKTGSVSTEKSNEAIEIYPTWDDGFEGCWTWGKDKAKSDAAFLIGRLVGKRWKIYRKAYSKSRDGEKARKKLQTVWNDRVFHTEKGQAAFDELIPGRVFQSPKPVELIKTLIGLCGDRNAIVLDFFSGSGTTAQAVIEFNESDGGTRRFIISQLPEPTGNSEFPTITDITRERARRVITRLNKEGSKKSDRGFRAFKLSSSNFKIWNSEKTSDDPEKLAEQLKLYVDNVERKRTQQDVLYELILKSGLPLSSKVEKINVAGKPVWAISDNKYLILLEKQVTREMLRGMLALKPQQMLCLDTAFGGDDALKTNTVLEAKSQGVAFHTV